MDEGAYRELLGLDLPNLEAVLLQHEGEVKFVIDEEEKERLNQPIIPKSRLTNVVLNMMIDPWNYSPVSQRFHTFTINDAILFKHSSLTRLRISYVDLTALENATDDMFPFENLTHLWIQISCISLEVFKKMLSPVKNLAVFHFHQRLYLPFSYREFRHLFWKFRHTLKVLKLEWRGDIDIEALGLDLSDFTALTVFLGHPSVLFGLWDTSDDLADQFGRRLPPNIKTLTLIQFCWLDEEDGTHEAAWWQDAYVELLRTIVQNKKELLPDLIYLLYQDSDKLMIPDELEELAEEQEIELCSVESSYGPDPLQWFILPEYCDEEAQEDS